MVGRGLAWVGLAWLGLACGRPAEDGGPARLAALDQQGKEMDAALDRLEERFLADQAQVDLWKELQVRHEHVSAIAAVNAHEHLVGMLKHYEHQEAKARALQHRLTAQRTVAKAMVHR